MKCDKKARVLLNEESKACVRHYRDEAALESLVIVITPDIQTGILLGRFMDASVLSILKARLIGEALPGVDVYSFGMEAVPDGITVELSVKAVSNVVAINQVRPRHAIPESVLSVKLHSSPSLD